MAYRRRASRRTRRPYRKSTARRSRRSAHYGRSGRSNGRMLTSSTISNYTVGPPNFMRAKLNYEFSQVATATTFLGGNEFAINDLFDPDFTGTGTQPRYYDQIMSLGYTSWRVTGCKISVAFKITAGSSIANVGFNQTPSGVTGTVTTKEQLESRNTYSKIISSDKVYYLTKYFKPWTVNNIPQRQYMSDIQYVGGSVSPGSRPKVGITIGSYDDSTSVTVAYVARLTFYATFFGLTPVSGS